jgi:hypothetical protein
VLVDDVVTTGVTLAAASRVTGCGLAVTATAVPEMRSSWASHRSKETRN